VERPYNPKANRDLLQYLVGNQKYHSSLHLITDFSRYMLRDPRLWGEDANEFKPERFLAEYNPHVGELPDVSCAFGFGRRCVVTDDRAQQIH